MRFLMGVCENPTLIDSNLRYLDEATADEQFSKVTAGWSALTAMQELSTTPNDPLISGRTPG